MCKTGSIWTFGNQRSLAVAGALEPAFGDADDREQPVVDGHGMADDVASLEARLPVAVPEHDGGMEAAHTVLVRGEEPAARGPRAKDAEIVSRCELAYNGFGVGAVADGEARGMRRGDSRERVGRVAEIGEIGIRERPTLRALRLARAADDVESHQRVGISDAGGRTQEQHVRDAEHRDIRADPDRETADDQCGEGRPSPECAHGRFNVVAQHAALSR